MTFDDGGYDERHKQEQRLRNYEYLGVKKPKGSTP
jgi:hypothetical protein